MRPAQHTHTAQTNTRPFAGGGPFRTRPQAEARYTQFQTSVTETIVAGGLLGRQPWLISGNRGVERPTNGGKLPEPQRRPVTPQRTKLARAGEAHRVSPWQPRNGLGDTTYNTQREGRTQGRAGPPPAPCPALWPELFQDAMSLAPKRRIRCRETRSRAGGAARNDEEVRRGKRGGRTSAG